MNQKDAFKIGTYVRFNLSPKLQGIGFIKKLAIYYLVEIVAFTDRESSSTTPCSPKQDVHCTINEISLLSDEDMQQFVKEYFVEML